MYSDTVWNTDTRRLEFTDGEAVGSRTLEQARAERVQAAAEGSEDSEEGDSTSPR